MYAFIATPALLTHLMGDVGAYLVHFAHVALSHWWAWLPAVGVLTFPGTDIVPSQIVKGAGKLYWAPQTVNGADPGTLIFVGATETGIDFHYARKVTLVETDQYLNAVMGFPAQETITLALELVQLNLYNFYNMIQTGDTTLVGGTTSDVSSSLTGGEQKKQYYFQIVWKGEAPPPSTNLQRVIQLWRCLLTTIGDVKFTKNKEASVKLTFTALVDVGAIGAGKAPVYQILDS
jgi:hypothetical protein